VEILVFNVGALRCAIPLTEVRGVLRAVAIVPLPAAPAVVDGLVDVRGEVLPVINLRRRLAQPPRALDPADRMLVTQAAGRPVVLLADEVEGTARAEPRPVEGVGVAGGALESVTGVARLDDGLVLIHDLAAFLAADEAALLDAALAAAQAREAA
jgi:purine-binding chemotaxis protein CheW